MSELLTVLLILLISLTMFGLIIAILKADRKVLELNDKVLKVREVDFGELKKIVAFLNTFNKKIRLGKIRYWFDIVTTSIYAVNIVFLCNEIISFVKKRKKA